MLFLYSLQGKPEKIPAHIVMTFPLVYRTLIHHQSAF